MSVVYAFYSFLLILSQKYFYDFLSTSPPPPHSSKSSESISAGGKSWIPVGECLNQCGWLCNGKLLSNLSWVGAPNLCDWMWVGVYLCHPIRQTELPPRSPNPIPFWPLPPLPTVPHSTASPNPPCPDWLMWQQLERGLVLLWPRFISPVTRFNTFQAHRIHYQLISRFGSVESTKLWSDISHHITHCPNNSPFATIGRIPFSMHFRSYWR